MNRFPLALAFFTAIFSANILLAQATKEPRRAPSTNVLSEESVEASGQIGSARTSVAGHAAGQGRIV